MKTRDFFLHTVAVAIGTTIALAIAGLYLKSQFSSATGSGSTIGNLLSLFSRPAASTGS